MTGLNELIDRAWDLPKEEIHKNSEMKKAIKECINRLDKGTLRIASKNEQGDWVVHKWLKKAVLMYFQISPMSQLSIGEHFSWWDKIPTKFSGWTEQDFAKSGLRAVPGSIVRYGSYIGNNSVLMPSFINIGAFIDTGVMIDTWATVGSCAQIGKNVHISGGAGVGGVLEPLQASPVIIEDNCFIGARSEIVEGVKVSEGSVISMGVFIGASTKIVYRDTGKIIYGEIPPYSVVVPGTLPSQSDNGKNKPNLYCAVIIKQVDEKTRAKTSINELLR